ncbi:Crotonobetainyl-CoA:carnitine CoA-transferase CaiB [Micromonospora sediminicola]|uniref:Crotonobetainyl-CoA:carnitine CoA-transferase CaiB n=1 Tax=Micromonospora sediminicola TaxID=946078 RepID=A0A1A9BCL9_9ACTN|nr:CoA transferase [Micromonospora sediminicola]SBT66836.1 Crotonobetainyl-CoA:carnitine CoA-transferase CaiB [Micromonospora sediminicola]
MPGPLHGVLVADFSRVLAGPYATMLLADLGADVVKVESPHGDDTRHWRPPLRGDVSTYYLAVNRNKRSVVLDLTDPDDLVLAHGLADRADVLIQNFRPGALRRFGLDHDTATARNARLVYASISGFGAAGGADLPGYDLMAQAAAGLMSLTGAADGPPVKAGVAVLDVIAGLHAALGILAALRHRESTGRGQHVTVDLLSSALSGLVNHASAHVAGGVVPHRMGNAHPSIVPYEPLPTADGELVVIAANDGQFRTLCRVLGVPELATDPRFRGNADRTAHRDELRPLLVAALSRRGSARWFGELRAAGVPCSPINSVAEGVALAEGLGLDPVVTVGGVPGIRHPIGLSDSPPSYDLPPPGLDAHGPELRAWLAGD